MFQMAPLVRQLSQSSMNTGEITLSSIFIVFAGEVFTDKIPTCEKDNCKGVVKPGLYF